MSAVGSSLNNSEEDFCGELLRRTNSVDDCVLFGILVNDGYECARGRDVVGLVGDLSVQSTSFVLNVATGGVKGCASGMDGVGTSCDNDSDLSTGVNSTGGFGGRSTDTVLSNGCNGRG